MIHRIGPCAVMPMIRYPGTLIAPRIGVSWPETVATVAGGRAATMVDVVDDCTIVKSDVEAFA